MTHVDRRRGNALKSLTMSFTSVSSPVCSTGGGLALCDALVPDTADEELTLSAELAINGAVGSSDCAIALAAEHAIAATM